MAADVVEATLVVDSRRIERDLGGSSCQVARRQMVFRGGGAYVELRVPAPSTDHRDRLHGQFLARPPEDASPGRVSVRVRPPHGDDRETEVGATGDFAVPIEIQAQGAVTVEFLVPDDVTLRLRFDP
jgi:hypothetical protein